MADAANVCLLHRKLKYLSNTLMNILTNPAQGNGAILDEKLSRLSKKPGVKASIVIDRASGSILKTSGDVSALGTTKSRTESTAASFSNEPSAAEESTSKGIDDFAAMIWNFVNNSGEMVEEMDKDVRCISTHDRASRRPRR